MRGAASHLPGSRGASRRPGDDRPVLTGLAPPALADLLAGWGEPAYRARQVFQSIHRRGVLDVAAMTDLPQALRERLREQARLPATGVVEACTSRDGTTKLLLSLDDGLRIETVIIPEGGRRTVCVSTQVGCPIGCVFCASGVGGLVRSLRTAEIVEQPLHALAHLGQRPSHVVVMGMGEPLLNLRRLERAVRLWTRREGWGLSTRRITVSTAATGKLVERLGETGLKVNLAVSLHAADDETRTRLVPTSRPGRTRELVEAAAAYARRTGRDATAEYVLIAGENDRVEDARRLGSLLSGLHIHLNLIGLNPVRHRPDLRAPSANDARAFVRQLEEAGVSVTLRTRRGDDIAAACGQLALERTRAPA